MPKRVLKKNRVKISGLVRVPSDIANQAEKSETACRVDFMMTPKLLFRGENDTSFTLQARLKVGEIVYYIAKEVGGESLTIGFGDVKPDSNTEREIKKLYTTKSCFGSTKAPDLIRSSFFKKS